MSVESTNLIESLPNEVSLRWVLDEGGVENKRLVCKLWRDTIDAEYQKRIDALGLRFENRHAVIYKTLNASVKSTFEDIRVKAERFFQITQPVRLPVNAHHTLLRPCQEALQALLDDLKKEPITLKNIMGLLSRLNIDSGQRSGLFTMLQTSHGPKNRLAQSVFINGNGSIGDAATYKLDQSVQFFFRKFETEKDQRIQNPKIRSYCFECNQTPEQLKVCGRCKTVTYCSFECQKKDWGQHKDHCEKVDAPLITPSLLLKKIKEAGMPKGEEKGLLVILDKTNRIYMHRFKAGGGREGELLVFAHRWDPKEGLSKKTGFLFTQEK